MKLDNRRASKNVILDKSYKSPAAQKMAKKIGAGPSMEKRSRPTRADALRSKLNQRYGAK